MVAETITGSITTTFKASPPCLQSLVQLGGFNTQCISVNIRKVPKNSC